MSTQEAVASWTAELGAKIGTRLNARAAARLGWTLFGLAVVSAATGQVLFRTSGSTAAQGHGGALMMGIVFPVFAGVGALIVSRRPDNVLGWLLSIEGVTSALTTNGLGYGYVHYALFGPGRAWPAGEWVAWLSEPINDIGFAAGPLLLLLFPTGRPPSARWRPIVAIGLGVICLAGFTSAIAPGPFASFPDVMNPAGLSGLPGSIATAALNVTQALGLLVWLVAVASVFARFRHARGVERQQLKWFTYAASLVATGIVVVIADPLWMPSFALDPSQLPGWLYVVINQFWALAVLTIPVSIGIAILRYRLYDIDLLINRTLVYGALVAAIVGIYVLVVGYIGLLFQARGDVVSLLAAGVAAVVFQPLRQRLQVGVNRLLYGRRDEPYTVLAQLGRRLETILESDAVMPAIVDTMRDALRVPYVALEVRSADGERIVAESGTPSPIALRIALPYQTERVGSLLVAARSPGEALGAADQQLLEDVARQAGAAVHAVGLTTELQGARERLVAAREEERRRLRRDLHDGFGPRLASLGLQLAALRNTLAADPVLQERVESLKQQTQEAVDDVRQLVDGLRPPALDELGLVGAVEQYAFRYSVHAGGLQVCVEVPTPLPALPAAVEVAAYRIITEALTNVVRHAQSTSCRVRLGLDGDTLEVEVVDDGRGLHSAVHAGTGLVSMRERAEEVGGSLLTESVPTGGTCIRARLPMGKPNA